VRPATEGTQHSLQPLIEMRHQSVKPTKKSKLDIMFRTNKFAKDRSRSGNLKKIDTDLSQMYKNKLMTS
jgi:hypothetical protein